MRVSKSALGFSATVVGQFGGSVSQVQSIMDSFRRIVRAIRTASRSSENTHGLRAAQLFVLQELKKAEPLSLNELAEKTFSHQSTVSVVVNSLVTKGLVARSPSKKDRRFLVLKTTLKGKALLRKIRPTIQERFSEAVLGLPAKEQKELAHLLEKFILNAGLSEEVPHFFFEKEPGRSPR